MKKDLLILVADGNMKATFEAAMKRAQALGIHPVRYDVIPHVGRDGGMRTSGVAMANALKSRYARALLVLDYQGSGGEAQGIQELEAILNASLSATWGDDGKVIVIHPELDIWMWGSDNSLAQVLGWPMASPPIRHWLAAQQFELEPNGKPVCPKEAMERVCRHLKIPRSSSTYAKIVSKISLTQCSDPSFQRTREALVAWFGVDRGG